jgi:predicted N-acetyltransferase YhbS
MMYVNWPVELNMQGLEKSEIQYRQERVGDDFLVTELVKRVFGPGRYVLTTSRLREHNTHVQQLGWIGELAGKLVGTVRFSPIFLGVKPALLLGPLAIDPSAHNQGCGLGLLLHGIDGARDAGHELIILVGDAPYYARAGFAPVAAGTIEFPGPVDPGRLLYVGLRPGVLDTIHGMVRPQVFDKI